MTSEGKSESTEFSAAEDYWQLEKLYIELADIKGRGLTPLEKKFLQGLLCGYSPAEIAEQVYQRRSSSSVRVYLSNGLYRYIQGLLSSQSGEEVKILNWSHITNLLEQAGYKKEASESLNRDIRGLKAGNWSKRIDLTNFVGRQTELTQLQTLILEHNSRIVALLGMGGLGKTWLSAKLVGQIQGNFEQIIWRSLSHYSSAADFLADLVQSLGSKSGLESKSPPTEAISLLLEFLYSHRCLLVLDQFESVLWRDKLAGGYEDHNKAYGELLLRLATGVHSSCCLLISREKPQEISAQETDESKIQSIYLSGLSTQAALKLASLQDLIGSDVEKESFVNLYANNPLAINHVSLTVKNLFKSSITEFLAANVILVSNLRDLLREHLERLCESEKRLLDAIAVNEQLKQLGFVGQELKINLSISKQLETVESLQRRGLIQLNSLQFCQESLLRPYLLEQLMERVESNFSDRELASLVRYILAQVLLRNNNWQRT